MFLSQMLRATSRKNKKSEKEEKISNMGVTKTKKQRWYKDSLRKEKRNWA